MSDRYSDLVQSGIGKKIAKNLGLPTPVALERYSNTQAILTGEVIARFADSDNTAIKDSVLDTLSQLTAHLATDPATIAYAQNFAGTLANSDKAMREEHRRFKVAIFDASDITTLEQLASLYEFFHSIVKKIKSSGRIIVIARPPKTLTDINHQTAQRAILGFVKSLAKEVKKGISANVLYVQSGLEPMLDSTLRFFMSAKSAYVSGQAIYLDNTIATHLNLEAIKSVSDKPLLGKKIVVTGASRGIGAAISEILMRDGAEVICVDLPAMLADLQRQAGKIAAKALPLDITDPTAAQKLMQAVGKIDGIVHNAGITKDKTLAKMNESQWQAVINVNLQAVANINQYLLDHDGFSATARIVCVSSIAGIAGNFGQTNYATSKAGIIGLTKATASILAQSGKTINAVAPGFIETKMTAAIPFAVREAGRRMNSMSQGGEPVDVAETIAWLLAPTSGAINGQTVRVCGQSLLGA